MPKRSSRQETEDPNVTAFRVVQEATREAEAQEPEPKPKKKRKDPAAVKLGRRGGKKGGPARAAKLSKERKVEIARQAALARWAKHEGGEGS